LCRFRFTPNDIFIGGSTNRPSWRACYASKMQLASLPPKNWRGQSLAQHRPDRAAVSDSAIWFAGPQNQRHRITNRPVLLIDDVMTTGATLYEAARTLQKAGRVDQFAGWSWRGFYAMGCSPFMQC